MITFTDTVTGESVACDARDIPATLAPWFPEPTREITRAIHSLASDLQRGEDARALDRAAFLAVTFART